MRTPPSLALMALALFSAATPLLTHAQPAPALSEQDYLQDMPIVLSVSRLPQRLDETPGAVTILDRDFIRQSGARDVADLLRLVPGFQTSVSFEADAPQAAYHGMFGNYSARVQVLVDGRSVYSTYFFGSVAPGLMSVALDDIERIEVLRGSNSAAYGARAMLGVVNIVTRHSADTVGVRASLMQGENGVSDAMLGLGWQHQSSTWRLTADQRGDDGLMGSVGQNKVNRLSLRGDVQADAQTEVAVRAGWMNIDAGRGFAGNPDAPVRDTNYNSHFAQLDLKHSLDSNQDVQLTLAHQREVFSDLAYYIMPLPFSNVFDNVPLDYSGFAVNDSLTLQHTRRVNDSTRYVWGGELRHELVQSRSVYGTDQPIRTTFARLFGNLEWRLAPPLILNLGAMAEHGSDSGDSLAPRAMLNWHVTPSQTLRAGVSRAYRPASPLEKHSNIRYEAYNRVLAKSQLMKVTIWPKGNVEPEAVLTRELGYLGELPFAQSTLDVRLFDEAFTGFIQRFGYTLPAGTTLMPSTPWDYRNGDNFSVRGFELHWQAKPWAGAQLGWSFSKAQIYSQESLYDKDMPYYLPDQLHSIYWRQTWSNGWSLAVSHQHSDPIVLPGRENQPWGLSRLDWRVGKRIQWGRHKGEVALTVQNQGQPYKDYNERFDFTKRAFVSLHLDL